MGTPQARILDMHLCFTPAPPPAPPLPVPVPIPIASPCAVPVLVGKIPASRITDLAGIPFPHPVVKGSATVIIQKLPAARITDNCVCGGLIVKGQINVLVGG